ncbi:hypothetical protein VXS02_09255 [Photobacterium piscicola]|uniref:hypothetical protein n=1 Tax=Photobacterium piscicola TaxID=1378299 RepID=UPI002E189982|nr:hypothetical protein [Photobacterium piscicola]
MSQKCLEEINTFSCNISLDKTRDNWKNHFSDFLDKVDFDTDSEKSVQIFHYGDIEAEFKFDDNTYSMVDEKIKDILAVDPDYKKITIKLYCKKSIQPRTLILYSPEIFVKGLEAKSTEKKIKFIFSHLRKKYDYIKLKDSSISLKSIYESKGEDLLVSNKKRAFKDVFDLDDAHVDYINSLMSVTSLYSPLCDYFLKIRTIASLSILSRKCSVNKLCFVFDGDKKFELSLYDNLEFYYEYGQIIYDFYIWAYCDERSPSRISIINHVFSQHQIILDSFQRHIFDILESNYRVYIADNFEQYVEVMSKLSDFLYETTTKISDKVSESIASARNTLILILSYFFTIIVFTGIDKGKVDNIFNFEITTMSTVFLIGGILNLYWLRKEIVINSILANNQLNEMVSRYSNYIDENELKSITNSQSLVEITKKSKQKSIYIFSALLIFLLLCLIWLLYYLNTPLSFLDSIQHDLRKLSPLVTKK